MALFDLSSAQLHRLIELVKEKETLYAKLARVERSLESLVHGKKPPGYPVAKNQQKPGRRRRRRVKLKDALLKKLESAGKAGLTVKELANSLKAKPGSVSVWFYTTGKKIKGIKKVGRARFAYVPE